MYKIIFKILAISVFLIFIFISSKTASASERRFAYSYETAVLNPGDVEIEPWSTIRYGRTNFYNRFDSRLEFEVGLIENLQTAWYLNYASTAKDENNHREIESEFKGFSSEWKNKFFDPVADILGLAVYFELSSGPAETEVEGKILADKRIGDFLSVINLIAEQEWEYEEKNELETKFVFKLTSSFGYFFTNSLLVGIEISDQNEFYPDEGLKYSILYAGPAMSYAAKKWWMSSFIYTIRL
jgi:hypothetical protein